MATLLAGCASRGPHEPAVDDAPPEPVDVSSIPNAVPKREPLSRYGNPTSYVVNGKRYYTMPSSRGYRERGLASWYGTKFHGKRTSSGEPYDVYAMTAAHRTLPLPSYVEVTNLRNNRSVILKVNDRGPFKADRIIDLSYAAAAKLGILGYGTGLVEVRAIDTSAMSASSSDKGATGVAQSPPAARASAPVRNTAEAGAAEPPAPGKPSVVALQEPRQPPPATTAAAAQQPSAGGDEAALFLQVGAFLNRDNALRLQRSISARVTHEVRIVEDRGSKGTFYKVQVGPLEDLARADRITRALRPLGINESLSIVQ
ncbi:MAG: septal ring lytic transglycosylase RlpA family protein [Gammaproteobacteria bacterium]